MIKAIGPFKPTEVYVGIECASVPDNPGGFATPIIRHGFRPVLADLQWAYARGIRKAIMHRPNGESIYSTTEDEGEVMNLDSRSDLMNDPVCRRIFFGGRNGDGSPVMGQQEFLDRVEQDLPGMNLWCYFGSSKEPDTETRLQNHNLSALWTRYGRAFIPWCNSRICHLVFDHAGNFEPGNHHGALILAWASLMQAIGREVLIEPQPRPASITRDLPFMVLERWWRRHADHSRPGIRGWTGHALPNPEKDFPGEFNGDIEDWLIDVHKTGCKPWINMNELRDLLT